MAAHAIWKASLRIGAERVGVKLYSAVQEQSLSFHLLSKKSRARVRQRLVHPITGETIESADVRRGAEVERGVFVVLDEPELAKFDADTSRDIEVTRFVPRGVLDARFYDRPYWLGPDEGQSETYFALARALEHSGREGIAKWSMRKRDYIGALRVEQGFSVLVALHHAEEVLPLAGLHAPEGRKLDERELKLGRQLIAALAGKFDPETFTEEYRERVLELVAAKRKGKKLPARKFHPHRVDDDSLAAALKRSLQRAA